MKRIFITLFAAFLSLGFFGCLSLGSLLGGGESNSQDADKWDIAALDTARNADYLSAIEKDVILEMNKARSNPALYAELYISPRLKKFDGKVYNGTLVTHEGAAVVNECVSFMSSAKPLPALSGAKGLSLAAQQHSSTQGETEQTGHTGVDGSSPFTRIEKYGTYRTAGENIDYGAENARDAVVSLLIDDGVSGRGHRKNIMSKDFSVAGVGFSNKHKKYGSLCVITFAGGYSEK